MTNASRRARLNRRAAIGTGLAGLAGLAWSPVEGLRRRAIIQRGIVGGGRVRAAQGEADFSVFASRMIVNGEEPGRVRGSVHWIDTATGLSMRSVRIADYQDLELPPKQGEGRRIIGQMRVAGKGQQPFVLEVVDAGDPGSGRDTVVLTIGTATQSGDDATADGSRFRYRADGVIVSGDVQAVELELSKPGAKCRRSGKRCPR